MSTYRIETDTLGEVQVPANALYGAQTQRAVDNFPISGIRLPAPFIHALGLIKHAAAQVNAELGLLEESRARYADLYDRAPVGYCTFDLGGRILEVNLTGAYLLGFRKEELQGAAFPVVAAVVDVPGFDAHLQ